MKNLYVIFVLVLLFLYGCKKQEFSIDRNLIGEWELKKSIGGFTGNQVVFPQEDIRNVLSFSSDHQYKKLLNGEITESGTYELIKIKSIFSGKEEDAIRFSGLSESAGRLISIEKDSLWLTDNHVEPFSSLFLKVK